MLLNGGGEGDGFNNVFCMKEGRVGREVLCCYVIKGCHGVKRACVSIRIPFHITHSPLGESIASTLAFNFFFFRSHADGGFMGRRESRVCCITVERGGKISGEGGEGRWYCYTDEIMKLLMDMMDVDG